MKNEKFQLILNKLPDSIYSIIEKIDSWDDFDFDKNEKDTVRLSASTLNQLFKDEDYNLKDIRKNKLVKPINIDLLPSEIKSIENVKKRKELFIQIILPLILAIGL